jgi:hypothetical protein
MEVISGTWIVVLSVLMLICFLIVGFSVTGNKSA